jgi:hypothetical protein
MGWIDDWWSVQSICHMIPRIPPPSRELEELVQYCDSKDLYLLVGCDSNAHTAWGSTNCNGRGEALMEFLDSSNLDILNRGNKATFSNAITGQLTKPIFVGRRRVQELEAFTSVE